MNKNDSNKSIGGTPERLGLLSNIITVYGYPLTVISSVITIISMFHFEKFEVKVYTTVNTIHIVLFVVISLLVLGIYRYRRLRKMKYVQAWKTYLSIQSSLLKEQNEHDYNSIEKYINEQEKICDSTSKILYKLTGRKMSVSIKLIVNVHGNVCTRLLCKSPSSPNIISKNFQTDVEFKAITGELLKQNYMNEDEYVFVWVKNQVLNKSQISVTGNDCYKSTAVLPLLYNDTIFAFLCIDGLKERDLNDYFTNHLLLSLSMTLSLTVKRIDKLLLYNDENHIDTSVVIKHETFKTWDKIRNAKKEIILHAAFYPNYINPPYKAAIEELLSDENKTDLKLTVIITNPEAGWAGEFGKILRPNFCNLENDFKPAIWSSINHFLYLKGIYKDRINIISSSRLPLLPIVVIDNEIIVGHYCHAETPTPDGIWINIIDDRIPELIERIINNSEDINKVMKDLDSKGKAIARYIEEIGDAITNGDEIKMILHSESGLFYIDENGIVTDFKTSKDNPFIDVVTVFEDNYSYKTDKAIQTFIVPEGVKGFAPNFMQGIRVIDRFELPDGLLSVGENSFANCILPSVIIPNNTQELGVFAFGHTHIDSLQLPESLHSPYWRQFKDSFIRTLKLPKEWNEFVSIDDCSRLIINEALSSADYGYLKWPSTRVGKLEFY